MLRAFAALLLWALSMAAATAQTGQTETPTPPPSPASSPLPDAPSAQLTEHNKPQTKPCRVVPTGKPAAAGATGQNGNTPPGLQPAQTNASAASENGTTPAGLQPAETNAETAQTNAQTQLPPCPPPTVNWFARFLNGPQVKPLTAKEKARLAVRNLLDPFNAVTILGNAAISVGTDSDSPYGPGMRGFGRYVGVEFTQDMTGEFFGTFLIPSIVHQDPHYHRLPNASIPHRIGHAILQVVWTQGDNGNGMLNYANLVGFAIDDEISNLYVPGRQTDLPASAARYATGLGTAPIDNFITEFLPDVARRIHVRVVLVQRIIDQVARTNGSGP